VVCALLFTKLAQRHKPIQVDGRMRKPYHAGQGYDSIYLLRLYVWPLLVSGRGPRRSLWVDRV